MKKPITVLLLLFLLFPFPTFAQKEEKPLNDTFKRCAHLLHQTFQKEYLKKKGELEKEKEAAEKEKQKIKEEKNSIKPKEEKAGGVGVLYGENGPIIAIDPGHQRHGNNGLEPVAPWSKEKKPKVSSGTQGVVTKLPEYDLNLQVSLKLKDELLQRGYRVLMIRTTHDVNISNVERAKLANEYESAAFLRIHADSAGRDTHGIMTIAPGKTHPQFQDSYRLSQDLLEAMTERTKAPKRKLWVTDTMSGSNWATVPVSIVEMGCMSNPQEDQKMATDEYQWALAEGMANGIDRFMKK